MLWMVRAFPGQTDQLVTFLNSNLIAVHWGISDLTGCSTKADVAKVVAQANLQPRDASLKTGLLHRFVNQMKIGDYCIVPYEGSFFVGKIKGDYYFDVKSVKFEHQRKVEWLFDKEPLDREELPTQLQTSLKSQLGFVDLTQHEAVFNRYLNNKLGLETIDDELTNNDAELSSLVVDAMNVLKTEVNSEDPHRRLQAAIAIMQLNHK